MILDSEKQRNLLLALLSEHTFTLPRKALSIVATEVDTLETAIIQASLLKVVEDELES